MFVQEMKRAFQKGDALLADISAARQRAIARLWWLGQSGFLVSVNGRTVLFDPYLSDSLTKKYAGTDKPHTRVTERVVAPESLRGIDVVTSSHNHTDHLDAETLLPILFVNPAAKLLIPRANRTFVLERLGAERRAAGGAPCSVESLEERLHEADAGEVISIGGVEFTGIPAAHNEVERDEHGCCRFLGYVAKLGSFTIYHSGDTLLHEGLAAALRPCSVDLALLPINGNKPERRVAGNMTGREAAHLARSIGARLVIPHHFDMFEFNTASPGEFEAECRRIGQQCRILRNGEGLDLAS